MPDTKNLCAHIPVDLYAKVSTSKTVANQTISEYVTNLLTEYFEWKENGGANMARENGKERTLAFQIREDLFQRIKAHLERESRRLGSKVTQKDFVIGLIEAALAEAERAEAERAGSIKAAQGEDTERRDETDTDSAPEENAQEAPCEDGAASENGEESQPTENG
ncbi:MAG: translation initiation factor 2 [Oscillibacter sp.]|nr:translation initiation factor 2 [Oscillibacter sp.]